MTDREKVVNGLECCEALHNGGDVKCATKCPYWLGGDGSVDNNCRGRLIFDVLALLKAQEPIEARLHLCESCAKEYPECDATSDDIMFGRGIGNDNVIGCAAYVNKWKGGKTNDG